MLTITRWNAGCSFESTCFFIQIFNLLTKALRVTCQAAAPPVLSFSGFGAIYIGMPQSQEMAIRRMYSDPHGLAQLPKLVPIPAAPHVKPTGYRCLSLYFLGGTPPLLSLVLPVDILLFVIFFQISSFPKAETLDHPLSFTKHVKSVLHINRCHTA